VTNDISLLLPVTFTKIIRYLVGCWNESQLCIMACLSRQT